MAIDFPNSPIGGVTTYDFMGIRYIYAVGGHWDVANPGSYGIANVAEVNTGTDPTKYIPPLSLAGSDYKKIGEIQTFGDARWLKLTDVITDYLATNGTAVNSSLLEGSNKAHFNSASNLSAGTVPVARLPAATTTAKGAVEAATIAEMNAGTAGLFPDADLVKRFAENASNLISGTVGAARLPASTTATKGASTKWELVAGSTEFLGCMRDNDSGFKIQWGKTSVGADMLGGNTTKAFTFKVAFSSFIFNVIPTLEADDLGVSSDLDAALTRGVISKSLSAITMGYDERGGTQDALFGYIAFGI